MVEAGIDSTLRVAHKGLDDPTVDGPNGAAHLRVTIAQQLDHQAWRLQNTPNRSWRSPAIFGSLSAREINASDADVVNLHWVTDGFISVREIGRITKPVVWSLVDMWPFSGTEHYGADTADARWRSGYTRGNRPTDERGMDLDRNTWERKLRGWTRPMHIVASNNWMRDRVESSALFRDWPVSRIPHVIDCTTFAPVDTAVARNSLGLPQDRPLILFVSSAGIGDTRKGWDLLQAALPRVQASHPDAIVVVAGPEAADDTDPGSSIPIIWLGQVHGDAALASLYSAVDVIAVPSREDNMPLVAMEAQTCGRPVVAFAIGGLPDIVVHHATGYLAQAFDTDDLATGLIEAIGDSGHDGHWSTAARDRALRTWSPSEVVARYEAVYAEVMK
jgi:glycosyltransferase involved in cell wall biosynthesis